MRIYTKEREPALGQGVASLLLAAFDAEPGDVYLVSPWLRDVELPVAGLGHFTSVFAGSRESVWLSDLLGRLAMRHRVTVITLTPAELVPLASLRPLYEVLRSHAVISAESAIRDYDAVDRAAAALIRQADLLSEALLQHSPTLKLSALLQQRGAELRFLPRLHAKLLWTPAGSLLGSANFSGAGLSRNEELMLEITSASEHLHLGEVAKCFVTRAIMATDYNLHPALKRAGLHVNEVRAWTDSLFGNRPELDRLLRKLLAFVR